MWIYETIHSYMETNEFKVVFQLPPHASMQHFQLWSLKAVICYCYLHGYDLLQVKIHDDLFYVQCKVLIHWCVIGKEKRLQYQLPIWLKCPNIGRYRFTDLIIDATLRSTNYTLKPMVSSVLYVLVFLITTVQISNVIHIFCITKTHSSNLEKLKMLFSNSSWMTSRS